MLILCFLTKRPNLNSLITVLKRGCRVTGGPDAEGGRWVAIQPKCLECAVKEDVKKEIEDEVAEKQFTVAEMQASAVPVKGAGDDEKTSACVASASLGSSGAQLRPRGLRSAQERGWPRGRRPSQSQCFSTGIAMAQCKQSEVRCSFNSPCKGALSAQQDLP